MRQGDVTFLIHVLVLPSRDSKQTDGYDLDVLMIDAMLATACKESLGAKAKDVSPPNLALPAELPDWPGFDLLSRCNGAEHRPSEVKGQAGTRGK
jgi:hypothetical protein